jgi:leader peptidase (prepilin peptidase) / N-methyltransferase
MMRMRDPAEFAAQQENLKPRLPVLLGGATAIAVVSFAFLPWPAAIASLVLGTLMIAGADVDARMFLLPDTVTYGALLTGLAAAYALNPLQPRLALQTALVRAVGTAALLLLLRWGYARLRRREGLGLGDVKLAAGVGAWLPLNAIPLCFAFAAGGALVLVMLEHLRGRKLTVTTRIPLGAFLCPSLWLVFYLDALASEFAWS